MKFNVTYDDGTTVVYKSKPRHLIRYEDEVGSFDAKTPSVRDSFKLAYICSGTAVPFDEWIDSVDDIEAVDVAGAPGTEAPADEAGEPVPTS